jgi:hypothetical protein
MSKTNEGNERKRNGFARGVRITTNGLSEHPNSLQTRMHGIRD